jgi:tRNA A-37 threonylcarbamoyl transferase component Bud32
VSIRRAPWWMYVIAASLLGAFAMETYLYFQGPTTGIRLYTFRDGAMLVEEVLPESPAAHAGLQAGDRILAIDNRLTKGLADWDATRLNFQPDHSYPLEVERAGKRLELTLKTERRSWQQERPIDRLNAFVNLTGALAVLLLAFFVAFRRPRDPIALLGALLLALLFSPGFVMGYSALCRQLPFLLGVLVWWPLMGAFFSPPLFFSFCAIFPRKLFRARWIWVVALAPSLLFVSVGVSFFYFTFFNPRDAGGRPDLLPRIGGSLLLAYILAGLLALLLNYRRLDANEKRRVRVLVGGTLISFVGLVPPAILWSTLRAHTVGTASIFFSSEYRLLTSFLSLALPISWTYAILRHRLFDVSVIVRQGVQYALARGVLLTAVPMLGLVLVTDLLLHGQQPLLEILRARGWIYVALAGLAVLAYMKRQSWLEALDRRFFRESFDAQRLLREVVEETREARSFTQVAPRVVARVEAALHPEFAALLVREPREANYRTLAVAPAASVLPALPAQSKLMAMVRLLGKPLEVPQTGSSWIGEQLPHEETEFLRQARVEFLVPIATAPDRTEALLVLGIKRSEEPYSREDRDLLMAIAASLALLLEKPSWTTAQRSDAFEECPQCGACYDSGATQCAQEGARLVPVILPRLLEGRYGLERRLGRGGMGTVYLAMDTALERRVAVKVIREDLVGSAEAAERFRQEARVAASFAHPNVVTVHDFGVAAGTRAFLVMELQEGGTLREGLRREKRFSTARALAILGDVAAALEAAHRRQLVHRDLKPENIFLARNESGETAKVLDFGIAKFLSSATQQRTSDTAPGAVLGTPRYMSPEQWHGGEAHPAWDVWALGVVAYEILTGAYPFDDVSPVERFGAGPAAKFTPLTTHLPRAPQSCQELFERSFAREPAGRPHSAQTFLSELQSSLS